MIERGRWHERFKADGGLAVEPWSVSETAVDPRANAARESLFAVGNGYLGIRGNFDEGTPPGVTTIPGTYLNGFHERGEIVYPEDAYGLARVSQTMLNVTSGTGVGLWLDGERVTLAGAVGEYRRSLDMRSGVLTRSYLWRGSRGARARLAFARAVSMSESPRAGLRVTVEPLDGAMALRVTHRVDGRVENQVERGDPRVGSALAGQVLKGVANAHEGGVLLLRQRAPHSGLELVCAAAHTISGVETASTFRSEPLLATADFAAQLDRTATLDVQLVYLDSRQVRPDELAIAARRELAAYAESGGVSGLFERQRQWLEAFWRDADVEVDGDAAVQQSLRFSLFHLLQGAGRDGRTNIASKGLSGEGYEGHTFWDSETYVVPVFTYLRPELARAMLAYRVDQLPAARDRARELRRPGALYPWRTIMGAEASAYYPAGTAQIHIDGDITLALERYLQATTDLDLMWQGGADVVIECARYYSHYGMVGGDGSFHLHTVTGPDEYTALIDDNHYTNKVARQSLRFAVDLAHRLRSSDPERFEALATRLALTRAELASFARCADHMHLPVAEERGITPQDASFLGKPEWPWDSVPAERYPLLLSYHPLDIYRHQVLKQADVLLAHVLLPEDVPRWRLRRDAGYYAARTTHDSSLSACAHAIVAAELNLMDSAVSFFAATARTDLDDLQGNGEHGVHVAAMGGAWLTTVLGFAGLRIWDDVPTFRPRLPPGWRRLRFRLRWRGRSLEVDAGRDTTRYRLLSGEDLVVGHRGRRLELSTGQGVDAPTRPRLRGVAFDLDGVLADSAELHYRAWRELADELDIPFGRADNESLRGIDRMTSLERILVASRRTFSQTEKRELAARKNASYRRLIDSVTSADLLPGVRQLLDELAASGLPLALASASRNAPALLARLGIADRFAVVVDPATLELGKPDPEIFERAAAALGFATDECAGVEDAAAGVAAIVGAGMAAVGVGPLATLGNAQVVVSDTSELSVALLLKAHVAAGGDPDGLARP